MTKSFYSHQGGLSNMKKIEGLISPIQELRQYTTNELRQKFLKIYSNLKKNKEKLRSQEWGNL